MMDAVNQDLNQMSQAGNENNQDTNPQTQVNDAPEATGNNGDNQAPKTETPMNDPQLDKTSLTSEQEANDKTSNENAQQEKKTYNTKQEIVARLREIVAENEYPAKEELENLKTTFYKLHLSERENQHKEYIENGGDPETYTLPKDEAEEEFKAQMSVLKERRSEINKKLEEEKQENLQKKLDIIEQIKNMATSPDKANKSYTEFKALQQQWKEIKNIPQAKAAEIWRNYQLYVEQYYDLLKLNNEAREYDFKKNLEIKVRLCEAAENLDNEQDVISAFQQLQELHQEFRETGPVAKELREEIWNRFKQASTTINKKHQAFYESKRQEEQENLLKKTTLCERIEEIVGKEKNKTSDWRKQAEQIIDIQREWKTIGFATPKMNLKIFERFRKACDEFFEAKAEHMKKEKEMLAQNAEKKKQLIETAKALSENPDSKETTKKFVEIQKQWKTIGPVPNKISEKLWNEFTAICNKYFEERKENTAEERKEEKNNLEKKQEIIQKLQEASNGESLSEDEIKQLVEDFKNTGHVPFHAKNKIYKEFHDVVDKIREIRNISIAKMKIDEFKNNLAAVGEQGMDAIESERRKLIKRHEMLKQELQTYENNLGFLNANSKKGNSLINELTRKATKWKDEIQLIKDKIKEIDKQYFKNEQ